MSKHTTLPGFRDFYPPDHAVRAHVMNAWRTVAQQYGFEEYDGPPLESLELYTEKSGEEIVRQLYNFTDKGGREVALRPEMTPTLARMVGARAGSLRRPIRWFSMPQLFRYERTQRGRLREHFQWNVDILGEDDIAADAEVLAVALDALRMLGLGAEDIVARFNDRRLAEALLAALGVASERTASVYNVIDKLGRETRERSRERLLGEGGMSEDGVDRLLSLVDEADVSATAEAFAGDERVAAEVERLRGYEARLQEMGLGDFIRFDPSIVRGLAYYTGTVFEIFDRRGELRAVCGGGRYDRLLGAVSGSDLPAVGFGMGDVVLTELLRDRELLPATTQTLDAYLVTLSDGERPVMLSVAQALRGIGWRVSYALKPGAMGRQLKEADARGAARVLILGPDEVQRGIAALRVMSTGEQHDVELDALIRDPRAVIG